MTTPARRHPRVVNLDEVETMERGKGRFGAKAKRLGAPTGAKAIGFNWMELAPGKTSRVSAPTSASCTTSRGRRNMTPARVLGAVAG